MVEPASVGKSFMALVYSAVRSGHIVRFVHAVNADGFFKTMAQLDFTHFQVA